MKLARLSLAALFLAGTACSSAQLVHDPVQFLATHPDLIVVTYDDNSEVPVAQPRLSHDTIIGTWDGLNEPVAVPLSHVQRVDAVQKDSKRTTMLIVGLVGITAVATYGFVRAVQDHGMICDATRPEDRQCYVSSGGP
jgi:hypothetical protein